jgi:hypothetical protein
MVEIFGEYYYIDLDKINEKCEIRLDTKESSRNEEKLEVEQTINVFKYDTVKQCIDTILTEQGPEDGALGLYASDVSLPFKFAFNTLINYEILRKYDE